MLSASHKFWSHPWTPVGTSLAFFIPAGYHYHNNDIFAALCVFLFGVARAGYKVYPRSTNASNSSRSLTHDALFIISCLLMYLNTIYLGVQYRPDVTFTVLLCIALYKSIILMLDISSDKNFSVWNIYMVLLLCLNFVIPNVGYPLSFVSFGKGLFWGAAVYHCKYTDVFTMHSYTMKYITMYPWLTQMHLVPIKPPSSPPPRVSEKLPLSPTYLDKLVEDDLD